MEEHEWLVQADILKGNSAWFEIPKDFERVPRTDLSFDSFILSDDFGKEEQRVDKDLEVEKMRWKKSCFRIQKKFEKFDNMYNKKEFLEKYNRELKQVDNFDLIDETVDAESRFELSDIYSAGFAEIKQNNENFYNKNCGNENIERTAEAAQSTEEVKTKTVDEQKGYNEQNCLNTKIKENYTSEGVFQSVMGHCENFSEEKRLEKKDENLKKNDADQGSTSQLGMTSNNIAGENFTGEAERMQYKKYYNKQIIKRPAAKNNKKALIAPEVDLETIDAPVMHKRRVNKSMSNSDYSIRSGSSRISNSSISFEIPQILITQSSKADAVPRHWMALQTDYIKPNYDDALEKKTRMSWFELIRGSHNASSLEEWFFGSSVKYDEESSDSEDDLWQIESFSDSETEFSTAGNASSKKMTGIKKKKEKKNVTVMESQNTIEYVNADTNENEFLNEKHEYMVNESKPYDVNIDFEENIIMQNEDHLLHKVECECLERAFENETPWEFLSYDQIRYVIGLMKREIWAPGTCPVLANSLKPSLYFLYSGVVNFVAKGFFTGESVLFSKKCESFLMAEEVINDLSSTASVVVAGGEDAILWTLERSNFDTKVKEMLLLRQTNVVQTERFLTKVPVLNAMHPDDIMEVAKQCKVEAFQANQVVFREKRPGEMFYIIASGTAVTLKPINSEVVIKLGEHGPTNFFGFMGVECKKLSNLFVAAKTTLKVLCLNEIMFKKYLGRYRRKLHSYAKQRYIKTSLNALAEKLRPPLYAPTWTHKKIARLVLQIQKLKGDESDFSLHWSSTKPCWTLVPDSDTVHTPTNSLSVPIKSCLQMTKTKINDSPTYLFSNYIRTVVSVDEDTLLPSACIADDSD